MFLYVNFKIVHRDLKPENILVTKDQRVILIDFGTARTITSSAIGFLTQAGTPAYQAPEVIVPQAAVPMNFKADIWSLGCILHFICNKEHAFQAESYFQLATLIN